LKKTYAVRSQPNGRGQNTSLLPTPDRASAFAYDFAKIVYADNFLIHETTIGLNFNGGQLRMIPLFVKDWPFANKIHKGKTYLIGFFGVMRGQYVVLINNYWPCLLSKVF